MIDSGRPTHGLPPSNAALAARPRRAEGCCAAHKIFDFAGTPNRGASAEAQCGTAPRAARDLPARPVPRKTAGAPEMERPKTIPSGSPLRCAQWGMEPCSPRQPLLRDGSFSFCGQAAAYLPPRIIYIYLFTFPPPGAKIKRKTHLCKGDPP